MHFHAWRNLPSQNRVTSVRLSLLNKFENVVAKLLPKLFHLRQNCCWWKSMMPPLGLTPWPSLLLLQPPGYLPSWSRSCPIARPAMQKESSIIDLCNLAFSLVIIISYLAIIYTEKKKLNFNKYLNICK